MPASSVSPSPLVKVDRKKLKKLRKRAACTQNGTGEQGGLLTPLEWKEFQRLSTLNQSNISSVGPSVIRRKGKEGNKVEGSHHRDLLAWVLTVQKRYQLSDPSQSEKSSKKRRRNTEDTVEANPLDDPTIPSWASIHNPGSVEGVAVLEIQVPRGQLEAFRNVVETTVGTAKGRNQHWFPTKWFQGHIPRPLSDSLFHFLSQPKQKRPKTDDTTPRFEHLIVELEKLVLDRKDWPKEGYPQSSSSIEDAVFEALQSTSTIQDPSTISHAYAKDWVQKLTIQVESPEDEGLLIPYVCTRSSLSSSSGDMVPRVFGMDCEMVLTSAGSELARITLVQFDKMEQDTLKTTVLLDALVKPENAIKSYLTKFSGITAELLEPITTRLEQVQVALLQFLRPTDILVGHSLENDLRATRYIHPRVIDTSILFRHANKRTKFSLRHLTMTLLKKSIQKGSHCSEEDALATLELAVRRAWHGDMFQLPGSGNRRSLLELFSNSTLANSGDASPSKGVCIGPPSWLEKYVTNQASAIHALGCESIEACRKAILAWIKGPRKALMTWGHLIVEEANIDKRLEELRLTMVRDSY